MSTLATYPKRYCPVCDSVVPAQFRPGPGGRPDASCPECGSLERHRFLAVLLACLQPTLGTIGTLLDVAPSSQVTPLLARLAPRTHLRLDLGADNRLVDVLGSLTALPLPDNSIDLMVCYHVLEHIPDDRTAMREITRVLRPGGLALLQVPYRAGSLTDEDPEAPVEERLRRFGQADHVRYYGDDFEDRLVDAGLAIHRVTSVGMLGEAMSHMLKLNPAEVSWLVTPSDDARVPPRVAPEPSNLARTLDVLIAEIDDEHRHGEAARAAETRAAMALAAERKAWAEARLGARVAALLPPKARRRLALRRRLGRVRAVVRAGTRGRQGRAQR